MLLYVTCFRLDVLYISYVAWHFGCCAVSWSGQWRWLPSLCLGGSQAATAIPERHRQRACSWCMIWYDMIWCYATMDGAWKNLALWFEPDNIQSCYHSIRGKIQTTQHLKGSSTYKYIVLTRSNVFKFCENKDDCYMQQCGSGGNCTRRTPGCFPWQGK